MSPGSGTSETFWNFGVIVKSLVLLAKITKRGKKNESKNEEKSLWLEETE